MSLLILNPAEGGEFSAPDVTAPSAGGPKLMGRLREAIRSRRYSPRTEEAYCHWVRQFIYFHHVRNPAEMAEPEINAFLTHLAVDRKVSASTQSQALSALLFLYRHVLRRHVGELGEIVRARRPQRVPVVMSRGEVRAILEHLAGDKWPMVSLMYEAGQRLMECLGPRVKDLDFQRQEIVVRDGKGAKDRRTILPESLKGALDRQLAAARRIHDADLAAGWGRVAMPDALDRKYPNTAADWRWQWVFPQERRWRNPRTGQEGRHHVHETVLQRAVKDAVRRAMGGPGVGLHRLHDMARPQTHAAQHAVLQRVGERCRATGRDRRKWAAALTDINTLPTSS